MSCGPTPREGRLRHVTYRNLSPWKPLDELLLMPMKARIAYIRKNLGPARPAAGRRQPYLTLDEFAIATGAKSRDRPIGWEKGQNPRDYAGAIAALTQGAYPPAALGADGEAELFEETIGRTLRSLREEAAGTRTALLAVLGALAEHGIQVQLDPAAPGSLATPESADQGQS